EMIALDPRTPAYQPGAICLEIESFEQLEATIRNFSPDLQNYLRRRWFLWKCAQCDEYLFNLNPNVKPNPNPRDKTYDIRFDDEVGFDVKGTVIPLPFRKDIEGCIRNPQSIIDFYYDKQSTGIRHCFQNRLFIVHHSFIQQEREVFLRCAWDSKENIYRIFSENFSKIRFRACHGCKAGVIFILERECDKVSFTIDGLAL
ncbi:MAG: hypothetical protein K2I90_01825, partial [Odoribacter sp.]|nr:hypothetical protein [Odoribacter sp.]